ncbi:hypothetical protein FFLO_04768 [Filobasidium floriforme]|uniref:Beta-lactamase-related domain-containing protein n=1 Tax=Filobasidium floriforme TaxID=5210 RepID=A0A8K0JJS3_9TREE|nr:hypothetical protein FFLO_04768 [Filobasidium floriforme]
MFSSTKLVTTVACLQLCDKGMASLDDADLVRHHVPELEATQVITGFDEQGNEQMEDVRNPITLRLLLSHTSGFCYYSNDANITRWHDKHGFDWRFLKANTTVARYQTPLAFQPGAKWHYGTGIDWAGILVTRVTGRSLEDYFQEFIFRPMKMTSTSFLPNASIKERMMSLTQNLDNMGITAYPDNFDSIPFGLDRESDPDKVGPCFAGGAGLLSTALDYLAMLRGIMASAANDDGSSDSALLSSGSFRELFHDSIPSDADRSYLLEAMTGQTYHDPILLREKEDGIKRTGHSVGLLLNFVDSCYGRRAGSGCWDGAAKTQYWLDPVTGLAGVCMTNIFGPNPNPFFKLYNDVERAAYDALSSK